MSDNQNNENKSGGEGGFSGGFGGRGRGRGGRGRGRGGRGRGRGGRRGDREKTEWVPKTRLGRLVKAGKLNSIEDIFTFGLAIKEAEIVDRFLGSSLVDEVMSIKPVQKQTTAGQRTRFKAVVLVGDSDGHLGMAGTTAAEVANAIRGALTRAKMNIIPVRRGYWGSTMGNPHTVPSKVTGKGGSVRVRLIPAPRGTGIVAARAPKKLLQMAGVKDCYTSSSGQTASVGNFLKATFNAVAKTYAVLTPDLWTYVPQSIDPFTEFSDFLSRPTKTKRVAPRDDERR